jgi:hypothetical protein
MRDTGLAALALATVASLAVGCGRRATPADCQLIVDRSVELQMKQMRDVDPALIQKREAEVRTALAGEMKSCETRRVTDRTMACVRGAKTTQELDACLR